jgi:hypothetical protein
MITDLSEEYSISKLCEVLDLPRSTYYLTRGRKKLVIKRCEMRSRK